MALFATKVVLIILLKESYVMQCMYSAAVIAVVIAMVIVVVGA